VKQAIWSRVGPITGILAFAATFIGASVHGFPDVNPTDAQLAKWLATVDLNTFTVGIYIEDLSTGLGIVFAVWLYGLFRKGGTGASLAALVFLCANIAGAIATFPINALTLGLIEQSRHGLDIRVSQTIISMTQAWFDAAGPMSGLGFLAAGVAILRGQVMSPWVGWAAIALGVESFVPAAYLPIWIGSLSFLWELGVAVYYTIRPVPEQAISAPAERSLAGAWSATS
jgi:hypothetical protein